MAYLFFLSLSLSKQKRTKSRTRYRDREQIQGNLDRAVITNQIAGLDTAPPWKIVNEIC